MFRQSKNKNTIKNPLSLSNDALQPCDTLGSFSPHSLRSPSSSVRKGLTQEPISLDAFHDEKDRLNVFLDALEKDSIAPDQMTDDESNILQEGFQNKYIMIKALQALYTQKIENKNWAKNSHENMYCLLFIELTNPSRINLLGPQDLFDVTKSSVSYKDFNNKTLSITIRSRMIQLEARKAALQEQEQASFALSRLPFASHQHLSTAQSPDPRPEYP